MSSRVAAICDAKEKENVCVDIINLKNEMNTKFDTKVNIATWKEANADLDVAIKSVRDMVSSLRLEIDTHRCNGAAAGSDLDACAGQVDFAKDVGNLDTKQAEAYHPCSQPSESQELVTTAVREPTLELSENDLECTVCYVRLHGLATLALNGAIGELGTFFHSKQRYEVFIHGRESALLVKRSNLQRYVSHKSDICAGCGCPINLCAFPPCDCEPKEFENNPDLLAESSEL